MTPEVLVPAAKALLIGTFAVGLVNALRESEELPSIFEKFAIGFLSLLFFQGALGSIYSLGGELSEFISQQGDTESLKELVLGALSSAAKLPAASGSQTSFNIPAVVEQVWRLGVWGIVSQIVDFFFILSSFLIESARSVFWQVLLFLFPLACAVYPVFSRILKNLSVFAVEISLWDAVLRMIQITTGSVAKSGLIKDGSLGLSVVAVELVAIVLTLSIPPITHRIVGGALNADVGGSTRAALQISRTWIYRMKGGIRSWVDG